MRKLIIYGGDAELKGHILTDNYVYQIGSGHMSGNGITSLNDSNKYLENSRNYRDRYVEYIYSPDNAYNAGLRVAIGLQF